MTTRQEHLQYLVEAAISADCRGDAAARNRARAEAVDMYALTDTAGWEHAFRAEKARQAKEWEAAALPQPERTYYWEHGSDESKFQRGTARDMATLAHRCGGECGVIIDDDCSGLRVVAADLGETIAQTTRRLEQLA